MLNKKLLPAALATALLAGATVAQADMEISGNVALTSDYKFRGISQSDEDIAIQGGFDLGWDNGIYIGAWGSTVDFNFAEGEGGDGSLELDYYVGWASDIGDSGFGIDVGYLYYDYPGDDSSGEGDYQEIYGSLSWNDLAVGIAYSDDYYFETDTFMYYYVDYSLGINDTFTIDFHVGYNDLTDDGGFLQVPEGKTKHEDSYVDYSVGITASWLAVDWTLAYVGTDLDEEDVFDTEWGDDSIIFTISKSM